MTAPFDPSRAGSAHPVELSTDRGNTYGQLRTHRGLYRSFGKRLLDILFVIAILPAVLPVILLLAALVALDGGKPFYSQARVGRGGTTYRMWKLRTMVPDADVKLQDYLADNASARAEWNHTQKLRRDPRVTRMGRFLRKTSLDELPQIWNVIVGEMSIVGPRPMMPDQRHLYLGREYYDLRPGITGLWQVSCRNASGFSDRAQFDATYHRTVSLAVDAKLILATVWVVLLGTGH
ncbi:sugar transferase [Fuscovulum ytuae]|uniref:Sugar transferase n=1 Tax=Fuscovulum ytuae TaxID=3042299 RepID=A0ABY8Q6N0_9RHOB|nr:sugar transferase [Fuscovulum sp. YMD61]WGV15942.1 sugar transferase [Fuscovulum sp. YMD61]